MKTKLDILEELKKEGMFCSNGNFNSSYPKKFKNSITLERQEWFDSLVGDSLSEKIYNLLNNSPSSKCKVCGKDSVFVSIKEGYRLYCCTLCRAKGEALNVENTCMKKYGTKAPAQNKSIQDKMKKTTKENYGVENIFEDSARIKKAFKDKYGVENPMHIEGVKDKIKTTSLERYGVIHPSMNQSVKDKRGITNINKYGNICSLHDKHIQSKIRADIKYKFWERLTTSDRLKELVTPLFSLGSYKGTLEEGGNTAEYPWVCNTCTKKFEDNIANGKIPRCPYCFPPLVQGIFEKELLDWLKLILPNEDILANTRKVISPMELDIFFPNRNLAIEFDEVYWHSVLTTKGVRGENYHIGKTLTCKDKNIKLLHIFDSEWWNKKDIVKSVIKANLNIFDTSIGARNCKVDKVSSEDSKQFLEENHLQGYAPSSIRYGLYFKEELISLLCLGKNRFKKNTYEVVRFVSKINTKVNGGLSKIWKEAKKELPENYVLISYVDLRFFTGESNEKLGLKYKYSNSPSFYYTKDYKHLFNRMAFQKHTLINKLPKFDSALTEWENMQLNGYDKIWDCGTAVYSNY